MCYIVGNSARYAHPGPPKLRGNYMARHARRRDAPGRMAGTVGACFITQGASVSPLTPLQHGHTHLGVTVLSTYIFGSSIISFSFTSLPILSNSLPQLQVFSFSGKSFTRSSHVRFFGNGFRWAGFRGTAYFRRDAVKDPGAIFFRRKINRVCKSYPYQLAITTCNIDPDQAGWYGKL